MILIWSLEKKCWEIFDNQQADTIYCFLQELRDFLKSGNNSNKAGRLESCFSLSLILHFLFQEHKDTRILRRYDFILLFL